MYDWFIDLFPYFLKTLFGANNPKENAVLYDQIIDRLDYQRDSTEKWEIKSSHFLRIEQIFNEKLKFRFSKKATKFDIYLVNVKSSGRLFQIFVAFSEYPNFNIVHNFGWFR